MYEQVNILSHLTGEDAAVGYDIRLLVTVAGHYGAAGVVVVRIGATGRAAGLEKHQVSLGGLWCKTHLITVGVLVLMVM